MTSRHPAVSCACPKCQSERRTPPTPAAEEREAVAQWCSGCHEVRSVDCYRAGCPKSDTERRAAEIQQTLDLSETPPSVMAAE